MRQLNAGTAMRAVWLVSAVLAAAGCGYSQTELFPSDYTTVAVPIFENRSFYRGIEFDVTEALTKEIELRTPYKVVSRGSAQTSLEGVIVSVTQRQLSRRRSGGGLPAELEFIVIVNFQWKDLRTGAVLRERQGFEVVGRYLPTTPIGETYQVGQHAAARRLAEQMVSVMRADW